MNGYFKLKKLFNDIAKSIKNKLNINNKIKLEDFYNLIKQIPSVDFDKTIEINQSFSEPKNLEDVGKIFVNIDTQDELYVNENGIYNSENTDGYKKIIVNVPVEEFKLKDEYNFNLNGQYIISELLSNEYNAIKKAYIDVSSGGDDWEKLQNQLGYYIVRKEEDIKKTDKPITLCIDNLQNEGIYFDNKFSSNNGYNIQKIIIKEQDDPTNFVFVYQDFLNEPNFKGITGVFYQEDKMYDGFNGILCEINSENNITIIADWRNKNE